MLHEASYGEGSPLGSSMFPASVKKLSANEIVAFRKSRFTASNIVVSSTGIPHDTVKKVVQYYFNAMPKTGDSTSPDSPYVGGDVRVRADLGGKTYLGLAFPIASGHTGQSY
jgi:predicted Zn-dependent peptidase